MSNKIIQLKPERYIVTKTNKNTIVHLLIFKKPVRRIINTARLECSIPGIKNLQRWEWFSSRDCNELAGDELGVDLSKLAQIMIRIRSSTIDSFSLPAELYEGELASQV